MISESRGAASAVLLGAAMVCSSSTVSAKEGGIQADAWKKKREFVYFLPKTRAVANVGQRILRCATKEGEDPSIETVVAIVDGTRADPNAMVKVDGRSGFLAKRTTKLSLAADGTLQAFNASTEGQGGDVAAALIKTAVTAGTFAIGGPPAAVPLAGMILGRGFESLGTGFTIAELDPPALECNESTKTRLGKLASVDADIARLESLVANGSAGAPQTELLAERKKLQKQLRDDLTLGADPAVFDAASRPASAVAVKRTISAVRYSEWFVDVSSLEALKALARIAGSGGFVVTLTPDKEMFDNLSGHVNELPGNATSYLFYRRPVPATIEVAPCASGDAPVAPKADCVVDKTAAGRAASANKKIPFAQFSGFYSIPIGKGGVFGSRQASAKFDSTGAPIELEYGSGSAGGDVAKMLTAVNDGATTLRDAEMAAWKRAADEATSRKTYRDAKKYLDDLDKAEENADN